MAVITHAYTRTELHMPAFVENACNECTKGILRDATNNTVQTHCTDAIVVVAVIVGR